MKASRRASRIGGASIDSVPVPSLGSMPNSPGDRLRVLKATTWPDWADYGACEVRSRGRDGCVGPIRGAKKETVLTSAAWRRPRSWAPWLQISSGEGLSRIELVCAFA